MPQSEAITLATVQAILAERAESAARRDEALARLLDTLTLRLSAAESRVVVLERDAAVHASQKEAVEAARKVAAATGWQAWARAIVPPLLALALGWAVAHVTFPAITAALPTTPPHP